MKRALTTFALTLLALALLDGLVALTLSEAEKRGQMASLVRYFEYGRSVPGKLERWRTNTELPGNPFDISWRDETLAASAAAFQAEPPDGGPVIRSYGMSFVDNILAAATRQDPALVWDRLSGPGAAPNYTYAMIEDDRDNRRAGDVVVFGVLSSSVPALAAMTNRSWAFEQPAPFTYPIYRPEGQGLQRTDPLITSAAGERALSDDPAARAAWAEQLAREDAFYGPQTFGLTWLDRSPFLRLVRRALATGHVSRVERQILDQKSFPYDVVLTRMIESFAETTRRADQVPLVMLIQTRDPGDADLLALTEPVLERLDIPHFATARHFDPRDAAGFRADGHYTPEIDAHFGQLFREILALATN